MNPVITNGTHNKKYLVLLISLMGMMAIMDQYLSTVKTTAIPYILEEYQITAARFSWLESLYMIPTFFIFFLNGLNDIIGRKWAALVLILLMGLSSLLILFFTPTLRLFMFFYLVAIFTTVSNMWTIPISEESPAEQRARNVAIVYVIGLIPLQAILPPIFINRLGLDWKWMYGCMAIFMIPVLILWLNMKETARYELVKQQRKRGVRRGHFFGVGVIDKQDLRYIAISAAIWLCWLIYSFLYYWAGYYFMTIKGYTLSQWSLVLLVTLILAMIGGVASGWIMDRMGRKRALIGGCVGLAIILCVLGFANGPLLPLSAAITGFFTSFTYTWVVVYVPEVFPTERRGACMGWTTTIARISYVVGPILAAILLQAFPTMEWFWVAAGAVMLLPIGLVLVLNPFETKVLELEEIEGRR